MTSGMTPSLLLLWSPRSASLSAFCTSKRCFQIHHKLFRGVCENDPSKICVERFIPQKEYINPEKPCRMNGTDRLYNYFTIDYLDCTGKDLILTSAHELRLQPSDSFWGAFFTIPAELGEMRIIDLRTRAKIPTDDKQFQRFLKLVDCKMKLDTQEKIHSDFPHMVE